MTQYAFYALGGVALFCMGLHAMILARHLVRKVIAFNIAGSGVFLLLVALTRRVPAIIADPVPQAMVLTGIVVVFGATAFALGLALHIYHETGRAVLDQGERPDGR